MSQRKKSNFHFCLPQLFQQGEVWLLKMQLIKMKNFSDFDIYSSLGTYYLFLELFGLIGGSCTADYILITSYIYKI